MKRVVARRGEVIVPKVCFIISPMGGMYSAVRKRADYVYGTYIEPACNLTDYQAHRADQGVGDDIIAGTTTTLENAPMAIAYMGRTDGTDPAAKEGKANWNANVMIEIGYRLASRLPLIFLCDENSQGDVPSDLPFNLVTKSVITLPLEHAETPQRDNRTKDIISKLKNQIIAQEKRRRNLVCEHAVAAINGDNAGRELKNHPERLLYTMASERANELFFGAGVDLVGRRLNEFYKELEKRMHPAQYRAFMADQKGALEKLQSTGSNKEQAVASIPIVLNDRAYLPIIVQDHRPKDEGLDWFNLRVLYLDVTTVTYRKVINGDEVYVCKLDPRSNAGTPLEPLKPFHPIRIFLSYRSDQRDKVEVVYQWLRSFDRYVEPFFDKESLVRGATWTKALDNAIKTADACFVFLDEERFGPGQQAEVDVIESLCYAQREYPVVPVLLASSSRGSHIPPVFKAPPHMPSVFNTRQGEIFDNLSARRLKDILSNLFPDRYLPNWVQEPTEGSQPLVDPLPPLRFVDIQPVVKQSSGLDMEGPQPGFGLLSNLEGSQTVGDEPDEGGGEL
jgi:hypothetical protein